MPTTVSYSSEEIQVLDRVRGKDWWWEVLLGWSPTETLNLIHTIIILLAILYYIIFLLDTDLYTKVWRIPGYIHLTSFKPWHPGILQLPTCTAERVQDKINLQLIKQSTWKQRNTHTHRCFIHRHRGKTWPHCYSVERWSDFSHRAVVVVQPPDGSAISK